jgi:hypothetical protein
LALDSYAVSDAILNTSVNGCFWPESFTAGNRNEIANVEMRKS